MKKIILSLVGWFPIVCFGQTASVFAESQNILSKASYTPIIKCQADYVSNRTIGFMMFFTLNPKWGEGIASVTVSPKFKKLDACVLSTGIGIEHANMPVRMMSTVFIQKKFFSTFSVFELGGSGWWYSHKTMFQVHKDDLKIGLFAERFTGLGPRIEFFEKPLTFFIGPVYDFESKQWRVNFGIDVFWSVKIAKAALSELSFL